jgi:hypothetical protein
MTSLMVWGIGLSYLPPNGGGVPGRLSKVFFPMPLA